jgi:hypothetical protein
MSAGTIVVIIVVVIVVAALIAVVSLGARRRRLQQRFGPEYDRAVEDSDSKLRAESELAEREKRVRELDIRPLDAPARARYASQWTSIQEQFVDSPANAVTGAQSLITGVMNDRGYPTEDADQIMADLSVEHARTLDHFRTAQDLSNRAAGGTASTEDLRLAMVHYRELFRELLGESAGPIDAGTGVTDTGVADTGVTAAGVTEPGLAESAVPEPGVAEQPGVTEPDVTAANPYSADSDLDRNDLPSTDLPSTDLPSTEEDSPAESADATSPAATARLPRR